MDQLWATLARKVLASILVDKGAIFVVLDEVGEDSDIWPVRERNIWAAVQSCMAANIPPLLESVKLRLGEHAGFADQIAALFNTVDNDNLRHHARQLREIGLLMQVRQAGETLAKANPENLNDLISQTELLLSGVLTKKANRNPHARDIDATLWAEMDGADINVVPTGLGWLDREMGGLWTSMNWWVAGAYKSGKTTLARNIIKTATEAGHPVSMFCGEGTRTGFILDMEVMYATQHMLDHGVSPDQCLLSKIRVMLYYAGKTHTPLGQRELDAMTWARAEVARQPLYVYDSKDGIRDLATLRYIVKRDRLERGIDMFWCDYSQIFGDMSASVYERQSTFSLHLPDLAVNFGVAACAISQKNEDEIRNKRGGTDSPGIKGGGDAGAAADGVFSPRIDRDTPGVLTIDTNLSRHTTRNQGYHAINPASGLIIDRWVTAQPADDYQKRDEFLF